MIFEKNVHFFFLVEQGIVCKLYVTEDNITPFTHGSTYIGNDVNNHNFTSSHCFYFGLHLLHKKTNEVPLTLKCACV